MNQDGTCWLDWLIHEIPDIRVFAFGYNSREIYLVDKRKQGHSNGRTFTYAEQLCSALNDVEGRQDHSLPLTFVGHGIGGLIIKNALVLSNAFHTLYGNILKNTHHVFFLDTPHRGLDTKIWVAVYGSMATSQAENQFNLWNEGLTDLGKYFAGIYRNFAITTTYSSNPIPDESGTVTISRQIYTFGRDLVTLGSNSYGFQKYSEKI